MGLIILTQGGFIGTITLKSPKRPDALSLELVAELIAALAQLEAAKARLAILRAQPGAMVWSAGHDVGELPEGGRDPPGRDDSPRHLVPTIETCRIPVIAMIEGGVCGRGQGGHPEGFREGSVRAADCSNEVTMSGGGYS